MMIVVLFLWQSVCSLRVVDVVMVLCDHLSGRVSWWHACVFRDRRLVVSERQGNVRLRSPLRLIEHLIFLLRAVLEA